LIFAIVMALLIVWKHRSNIQRLLAGKENKFDVEKDNDEEIAKL
jgi:glycerol-3-phosphate acyltransferase PlsY